MHRVTGGNAARPPGLPVTSLDLPHPAPSAVHCHLVHPTLLALHLGPPHPPPRAGSRPPQLQQLVPSACARAPPRVSSNGPRRPAIRGANSSRPAELTPGAGPCLPPAPLPASLSDSSLLQSRAHVCSRHRRLLPLPALRPLGLLPSPNPRLPFPSATLVPVSSTLLTYCIYIATTETKNKQKTPI